MLKNKRILLTLLMVVLLLLIPNIVKAGGEFVDRVDITGTIPTECILGEKATVPNDISVKINGTENMEWVAEWTEECEHGEGMVGLDEVFTDVFDETEHPNYTFVLRWKRPKYFAYTEDTKVYINGVLTDIEIGSFLPAGHEFYNDVITFYIGKAKARLNFDSEDIVVLDPEVGEIKTALPGTEIRLLAYGENSIDATEWKVTVAGKSGAVEVTKHDEYVSEEEPLPYYSFIMPAEDVTITAEYTYDKEETKAEETKEEQATSKEEKAEKDKTPKTGLEANKISYVAIGLVSITLTLGAVTIIKKK